MYRVKTGFTVAEAMTREPVIISQNKNLRDAAKLMAEEKVGALLVKEEAKVIGIITETDLVRKAMTKTGNPADRKIKNVMTRNLVTTVPDEDIFEAIRIMRDYNIRRLPVMHEGKFVGLIALKDILKIEPDLYEILVEKIELREMERKPII